MTRSCLEGPWGHLALESVHDAPEPLQLLKVMTLRPGCFFLDSALAGKLGQYSFLGCDPYRTVRARGRVIEEWRQGARRKYQANPFSVLRRLLGGTQSELPQRPAPFLSGAVGYLGYDLRHFVERLSARARRDQSLPDLHLAFYDSVVAYDHRDRTCWVSGLSRQGSPSQAVAVLERTLRLLERAADAFPAQPDEGLIIDPGSLVSNFTRGQYLGAVRRAIEYIAAGDIFQVNLSQRLEARTSLRADTLYRRLRTANPAPYAAYLDLGDGAAVLSSSPEQFLQVCGSNVRTRPIKGTRPRSDDPAGDARMQAELIASAKDNAELAMIVDLERNDLGRVCSYGSVRVTEPRVLETYARVHHLVATVQGRLHPRHDVVDLLKATFPGGSITGAPKIRAMGIIDELEPTARSLYTGAIGYFDDFGRADLNIAIRTMLYDRGRITFQVGGGIVADSVPEQEYQETLDKGRALLEALGATLSGKRAVEEIR